MATNHLTQADCNTLATPGLHLDGDGLFLDVRSATSASWVFRYTYGGKASEVGLGSRKKITLAQARTARAWCINELAEGRNPKDERKAQKTALAEAVNAPKGATVYELARDNVAVIAKKANAPRHRLEWVRSLHEDFIGEIAHMEPADVTLDHVKPMMQRQFKERPETAKDIRQRLFKLLAWARATGRINVPDWKNPCEWRGNLEHWIKVEDREVVHHKSMPFKKVGALVAKVWAHKNVSTGARLGLIWGIASVTRISETIGCDWSEFDWDNNCWVIPAARMKMGKVHRVALTDLHHKILDVLLGDNEPPTSGPVFVSSPGQQVSDFTLRRLLGAVDSERNTVHGFRSSFRDWAANQGRWATFDDDTRQFIRLYDDVRIEEALAHKVGNDVRAAYIRDDYLEMRRPMLEAWAAYMQVVQSEVVDLGVRRRAKLAA